MRVSPGQDRCRRPLAHRRPGRSVVVRLTSRLTRSRRRPRRRAMRELAPAEHGVDALFPGLHVQGPASGGEGAGGEPLAEPPVRRGLMQNKTNQLVRIEACQVPAEVRLLVGLWLTPTL